MPADLDVLPGNGVLIRLPIHGAVAVITIELGQKSLVMNLKQHALHPFLLMCTSRAETAPHHRGACLPREYCPQRACGSVLNPGVTRPAARRLACRPIIALDEKIVAPAPSPMFWISRQFRKESPGRAGGFTIAGPSKEPHRDGEKNGAPFDAHRLFASQSVIRSNWPSHVSTRQYDEEPTPANVKLLLPPRQSRGPSRRVRRDRCRHHLPPSICSCPAER